MSQKDFVIVEHREAVVVTVSSADNAGCEIFFVLNTGLPEIVVTQLPMGYRNGM